MTTGHNPTSGDYMRVFARTQMTGAAMRVAITLAGHISFDGSYRGAPRGFAAFTMAELEDITNMCRRTIRRALDELAKLFGLTVLKRFHDRHLFQFEDLHDPEIENNEADCTAGPSSGIGQSISKAKAATRRVMGHQSPTSLYTRTKSNNHTISMIRIEERTSSVHQSPYAEIINSAKKGTDAENMDTQFLWQGFHMLNARNRNAAAPLSWLVAFVRKAKPCFEQMKPTKTVVERTQQVATDPVVLMAKPAKPANRQFNEIDLVRKVGRQVYDARIQKIQTEYATNRFAAQLAVHGQAVRAGEIRP